MTFRSLWLENAIRAIFFLIFATLKEPLDIEIVLDLFLFRSGITQLIYYLGYKDFSAKYQSILKSFIDGFNK
ncbi:MAG: hypothetical protein HUU50_03630 [Candidatus Brocadiae bacterium]|nr:hypothetical protein [Candidatus Brocadiia bacterium]